MKQKSVLLTIAVLLGLRIAATGQVCWQQVSTLIDSYLRVVKVDDENYLCSANNLNSIYHSSDLISWNPLESTFPGLPHLAFNKDNFGHLFLTTSHDGVYKSVDYAATWSFSNVGSGFGCGSLDITTDSINNLYIGVGGFCRGLHVSNDGGQSWANKIPGLDFSDIESVNTLNQVYASSTNYELYFSIDNGNNWQQIINQPFSNSTAMIKHIDTDIYVFTNDGKIYISSNAGVSWALHSQIPISGTATPYENDAIFINQSIWWVGMLNNGVWRSADNGLSWEQQDLCLSGDFHYLFKEDNTILATTSEGIFKFEEVDCANIVSISPEFSFANLGTEAVFNASSQEANGSFLWQTDFGQGFQNVVDYGNYSGASTSTLTISDLQLINHNQPIRVISTSGICVDTSEVAFISLADTCITNVFDTTYITVTDTLIININPTGFDPLTYANTILMYPNPASDQLTINYGDFASLAGYSLKIFNAIGQEIHSANISQQQEVLQLATWGGAGTYEVVIYNVQGVPVETRAIVLE